MKNMVVFRAVGLAALLPIMAVSGASVTLTASSSGDVTISQALENAGATLADVTGNAVDDIVVTGNGNILFDTDISAYTGAIHISSGATVKVTALNGLGATSGKVYVADGGALIPDATGSAENTFTMTKGEIHIAGTGPDGVGALVAIANKNQRPGIWGGTIVLDGDAQIASRAGSCVLDFPKQYASTSDINLDMNGHTLTLVPQNVYIPVRMVVGNPGHIVVTNANLSMNNIVRLNGTAANTFTLKDNGSLNFFEMTTEGQAPWTLVHDTSRIMNLEQNGGRWDGPVRLLKTLRFDARTMNGNNLFNPKAELYGPISGEGGIVINSDVPTRGAGHLYLYSTNSFTGGVVLNENTYLHVMTDGAVPVTGAPIVMTNAFLDVQVPNCSLPSIDCFCSSNTVISGGHVVGTLTKSGDAKLSYLGSDMPEAIDLKVGTLQFENVSNAWYAGTYEGDRSEGWHKTDAPPTWGSPLFYGTMQLHDRIQDSFRWLMSATTFPQGGCSVYECWIYCSAAEAGSWRFMSNVIYLGRVIVDGSDVIEKQAQNAVCFGTRKMTEGWHRLVFRMAHTGASAGPNTSVTKAYEKNTVASNEITSSLADGMLTAWQNSGIGFAVCKDSVKAQAGTTDIADFTAFPSDPGDGSVFRLAEPGSAEEADLAVAFTNHHTVAALTAATNTTLDLCGGPLFVGSVTGFPTVVHTTIPFWLQGETPTLTVTTNWTASAEGIASGAAFTVTGGALAFADGATLTVPDSQVLADTHGGSLAVATATGGIAGMPELVFAEGDRRGFLRLSDDGKSLLLTVASGMTIIFR